MQTDADALAAKEREQELYAVIGKLKMQLKWLQICRLAQGLRSPAA